MKDGDYTYYTIQHRLTHQSKWNNSTENQPNNPLLPTKNTEWTNTNWDSWGHIIEPWAENGKHKFPESSDERHDVWSKTKQNGYWTLEYAKRAQYRLLDASEEGKLNSIDGYAKITQINRYEFRIIKIHHIKQTTIIQ